jgi:hypothetical protein
MLIAGAYVPIDRSHGVVVEPRALVVVRGVYCITEGKKSKRRSGCQRLRGGLWRPVAASVDLLGVRLNNPTPARVPGA